MQTRSKKINIADLRTNDVLQKIKMQSVEQNFAQFMNNNNSGGNECPTP